MKIFKRRQKKKPKLKYRQEELTGIRKDTARAIQRAKPEDFRVYPENKTLMFMDTPMETLTIWNVSIFYDTAEYIIGRYSTRDEAEYVMEDVIKTRALPVYNMPTIRELIEHQEVA